MGLLNPHLDDAALAELWSERLADGAEPAAGGASHAHLGGCAECRGRFEAFGSWLDGVRADAEAEADAIFTSDRLASQQSHITRRLEALDHPARVIAFPRFARPISATSDGGRRWVAVAAAAGLVVGLGLGQLLELRNGTPAGREPVQPQIARAGTPADQSRRLTVQPVSNSISDETFLYDQDSTAHLPARVPESLQYLNAITPSARDYDPR